MNIYQFLEKTNIIIPEELILKTFPDLNVILCKFTFYLEAQLLRNSITLPTKIQRHLKDGNHIPAYLWGFRVNKYNDMSNKYHGIFISKGFITMKRNPIFNNIYKQLTPEINEVLEAPMGQETVMQDLYIRHLLTCMPEYKIT